MIWHLIPTTFDAWGKKKRKVENIVRKEENAGTQHFLLFPQCFLQYQREVTPFEPLWHCRLQMLSIWTRLRFLSTGKGFSLKKKEFYIFSLNTPYMISEVNMNTACGRLGSTVGCLIEDKKSKSKKGHYSEKKNAFWIVSLDSKDRSLDNEHVSRVSSKYLQ